MIRARLVASWLGRAIPLSRVMPARFGPTFAIAPRSTP